MSRVSSLLLRRRCLVSSVGTGNKSAIEPILISIEGNIGAGKSTLFSELKKRRPQWTFIDEPLNFWSSLRHDDGKNLLETYYSDMARWGFTFQVCGFQSRFRNIENVVNSKMQQFKAGEQSNIFITERCLDTDYQVFTKMLHAQGYINKMEFQIYESNFHEIRKFATPLSGIVHLNTSPELCMRRIQQRQRPGEGVISVKYLEDLNAATSKWIENITVPVYSLQDCEVTDVVQDVEGFVERVARQHVHVGQGRDVKKL